MPESLPRAQLLLPGAGGRASGSKARRPLLIFAQWGCQSRPPIWELGPWRAPRAPAHLAQQVKRVAGALGPNRGVHARRQGPEAPGQRRVVLGSAAAECRVLDRKSVV